ncbi:MBL fold metallo-hydrolase [Aliiglaciecola sp. CAU 1673]|uniref:MBL fold metallo-hydrolase n=1 Tax=Aliiglaciecola sp. CAU 1673 TaxID=3032595 RepID=UPI0023DB1657|nr:MBL fold metallo-hydrolase [Aliiglaciecola sp. CAU 1673]MDF2179439.1 MBL fold metallo-hydrolase [Aliiglaciecola sp. CAU 1673]
MLIFRKVFFAVLLALLCTQSVAAAKQSALKVHRHVSEQTWSVNSYLIESEKGLLLIDGQMLNSDAKLLAAQIKSLKKPLLAAIITHAHSDHFAGFSELRRQLGEFPLYSIASVVQGIEPFHNQFLTSYKPMYGDDLESTWITPQVLESGKVLNIGDIEFLPVDLGAGEAEAQLVLYFPAQRWLFTGDATMHRSFYYVGEGHSAEALLAFERLKKEFPEAQTLYAGHGDPARLNIVDQHIAQVRLLRETVSAAMSMPGNLDDKGQLTREALTKVVDDILAAYPYFYDYGLDARMLMSWNVLGLVKELGSTLAMTSE